MHGLRGAPKACPKGSKGSFRNIVDAFQGNGLPELSKRFLGLHGLSGVIQRRYQRVAERFPGV